MMSRNAKPLMKYVVKPACTVCAIIGFTCAQAATCPDVAKLSTTTSQGQSMISGVSADGFAWMGPGRQIPTAFQGVFLVSTKNAAERGFGLSTPYCVYGTAGVHNKTVLTPKDNVVALPQGPQWTSGTEPLALAVGTKYCASTNPADCNAIMQIYVPIPDNKTSQRALDDARVSPF